MKNSNDIKMNQFRKLNHEFAPLPVSSEMIAKKIVDSAYSVHKHLGPGLLEKVYEMCFCYELECRGLQYRRQVEVPLVYKDIRIESALRLDVLVEDCVICELKAIETVNAVWEAQIISQLKLTGHRLGFLINFDVVLMKDGIRRFIL